MNKQEICRLMRNDLSATRMNLAMNAETLIQILSDLVIRLRSETDHDKLIINSLGEIQSAGTIIDAECGRLGGLITALNLMGDKS